MLEYISNYQLKLWLSWFLDTLSRKQFNQKLKLMVEVPILTHMRALWAKSVDAAYTLFIHSVKYSTLNEGWLRFELVTSCYGASDNMSLGVFGK